MGIQAKNNERLFANWAKELRNKKSIDEVKETVATHLIPYIAKKIPQFKSDFLNITMGAYKPLYRLRYILGMMENTVLLKAGLPIKGKDFFSELQIEHIFPQTPKNKIIPDEFADHDDYLSTINKLGNVLLLESTINQAVNKYNDLSNNWFELKQNEYTKSDVVTTNLINHEYSIGKNTAINKFKKENGYSFESWNKDKIKLRQKILMELAFESWKFNETRIDKFIAEEKTINKISNPDKKYSCNYE